MKFFRPRRAASLCLLTLAALFAGPQLTDARAQAAGGDAIPPSPIVHTVLLVHAPQLAAEEVFWAGVRFTIPEGWHIYWQNPGDSGIPTTYDITASPGLEPGAIQWPAPHAVEMSGLVNYGYTGEVVLPVPVRVSRALGTATLTLSAKWLVCKETCIPESANFTTALPKGDAQAAAALEAALATVPQPLLDARGSYQVNEKMLRLSLHSDQLKSQLNQGDTLHFFPLQDGVKQNSALESRVADASGALILEVARGQSTTLPESLEGVLEASRGGAPLLAYAVSFVHDPAALPLAGGADHVAQPDSAQSLPWLLLLAVAGGLLLNIMPCVLPILALKALAIAKKAQASRRAVALQGIAYTGGVIVSFLLIAGIMVALKAGGATIGWGYQLQSPWFVAALGAVMLLVAANLWGLFELPVLLGERASMVDEQHWGGSALTGALAVFVATPCSAPFMATAIGATLSLPGAQTLLIFAALGFGMALPFLLISFWPAARRMLPKPGGWMLTFKKLLAVPMLLTALWLFWVLAQLLMAGPVTMQQEHQPFSESTLAALRAQGKPVFVDATASWCLSCKVNERVALNVEETKTLFAQQGVVMLVADWTDGAPEITRYLAQFGRSGVPLYVYYPAGNAPPRVLPQLLTPGIVRDAILEK